MYTVHSVLVYTRSYSVQCTLRASVQSPGFLAFNFPLYKLNYLRNPLSKLKQKGLKNGIPVNRTRHSINGRSPEITLFNPLTCQLLK